MYFKYSIIVFCLLSGFLSPLSGQGFLRTNGKAIVKENGDTILLRGMGLGGWMVQEGYMLKTSEFANAQYQIREKIVGLIGEQDTELFYDAWLTNGVQKVDIDSLKAWGFNSVRLPMHYNLYTPPIEEEPVPGEITWLTKGFELTDSLLSWCAQNQMYLILDLHAAPGGQGMDQAISDYDPTKPSLWQSFENQNKMVALWKRLAERYADEPWIGGYDLLNETNWNLPGGTALKNLYKRTTDSIRTVDNNHIIFIEGNWFANDFTGLTPPWDDNMVYSAHKYWSFNDQASIQWVLNLRNQHNVPIWLGESGENSNTWFRDAIKLLEDNGIGWAWWPMKKIEDIAGPLSVVKTPEYQVLLNYWKNGGTQPGAAFAKATLMEMADNYRMENCIFSKSVPDAMIRQVYSDEAKPFNTREIPGVVYASDFDMGRAGVAYHDQDVANYHLSTGTYTAWNQGWAYRNDGVDIEPCSDNVNTNGYNVGWTEPGEWMQYDIEVQETAVYDIHMRLAAGSYDGKFHFSAGGADITNLRYAPYTGGYQTWQTVVVPNVVLTTEDTKLRFHSDGSGFNVNSFEFVQVAATNTIPAEFISAVTLDDHTIQLNLNKAIAGPLPAAPADFEIFVNGNPISITAVTLDDNNHRILTFDVDFTFYNPNVIKISYNGNQVLAQDGTALSTFYLRDVLNTVPVYHPVPGRVQAEGFFFQSGSELENTTDTGGGENVSHLDVGDYLDYYIEVSHSGAFKVDYRTASESSVGGVALQLIDENGDPQGLHTVSFPSTGNWQNWTTTTANQLISLPQGRHHIRVAITQAPFNLNWFEFTQLTPVEQPSPVVEMQVSPNPGSGIFLLQGTLTDLHHLKLCVYDLSGRPVLEETLKSVKMVEETIDLSHLPDGTYYLSLQMQGGVVYGLELVKSGH